MADANKALLVQCDVLIPTLFDALFLDPEHPRKDLDEALRAGIQCDGAECFLQLALVEQGKELLERHPESLDALRALADREAPVNTIVAHSNGTSITTTATTISTTACPDAGVLADSGHGPRLTPVVPATPCHGFSSRIAHLTEFLTSEFLDF